MIVGRPLPRAVSSILAWDRGSGNGEMATVNGPKTNNQQPLTNNGRSGYNLQISPSTPRIILASASPRRRELLKKLAADFEVIPSDLEEYELSDPWSTADRLAFDKASAVSRAHPGAIVIGADTVVAYQHLV